MKVEGEFDKLFGEDVDIKTAKSACKIMEVRKRKLEEKEANTTTTTTTT